MMCRRYHECVVVLRSVVSKHLASSLFLINMLSKHAERVVLVVLVAAGVAVIWRSSQIPGMRVDDGIRSVVRPKAPEVCCLRYLFLMTTIVSDQHKAFPQDLVSR
jgi:hypothetical protein